MSEARAIKIESIVDDFLAKAFEKFGLKSIDRNTESDKAFDKLKDAMELCAEGKTAIDDVMKAAVVFVEAKKNYASGRIIQSGPDNHRLFV